MKREVGSLNNIFIIHGSFGSNIENWFPWLKEQLDNDNTLVTIPQFPINELQCYDNWKELFNYYYNLGYINDKTTLIGHSIGCIFIVKYLLEKKIKVNKIILISGFNNYKLIEEFDKVNKSFFMGEAEFNSLNDYANEIISIHSDNDPYISLEELKRFSSAIHSKEILIEKAGHFNVTAGYKTFEEVLKYI